MTAVITALGATALIGFTGLGIDVASWHVTLRKMQGTADQAALAAGIAAADGTVATCPSAPCTEAKAVTATHGYVDGQANVTVAVNNPPSQGSYTSDSSAIEVIIQQPQSLMFTGLFLSTPPTVKARAVALEAQSGDMCVMALDRSGALAVGSVGLGGTSTAVNVASCDVYDNSGDAASTQLGGGATLNARNIHLSGGYTLANNASMTYSGTLKTYAAPAPDPYADLTMPSYSSSCTKTNYKVNGGKTDTISPGVYCGGIDVEGGGTLNLNPGTYILVEQGSSHPGNFDIKGGGTVTGTGVTIILTSSSGSTYGTVDLAGGSTVTISAPLAGATVGIPGVAFWVDKNAPTTNDTFNGGNLQNINGAIYMPSQQANYSGGSSTGTSCSQLIGLTVNFTGGAYFHHDCAAYGSKDPHVTSLLVE